MSLHKISWITNLNHGWSYPRQRSCWPGIFKTTKMKERFNICQSPICLAWNWSLFRWISPTKHLHWSGPVSPSRSMVDAQDATETFSVTPCQQKLNFRVCSQWPKSSQKPDRSVLVFSLCAHSVSQTCDLAYRNHCFRRWSSIRTHAHSQIHMLIDCTFYICIFLCTHTFESQNDVDGKADSIQTLWNRASLIQVSLLVATGMVASLKSQLSCLVSRQTWSISILTCRPGWEQSLLVAIMFRREKSAQFF